MRWFMVASLVLTACGDEDTEDTESLFVPTEGEWTRIDGDMLEDTCGLPGDGDTDEESSMTLTNNADGTLAVVSDTATWTCTLAGMDFTCDDQLVSENDVATLDALIKAMASPSGTFSSVDAMSGELHVELTCTGEDCGTVETSNEMTFPCTRRQAWTASAGAPE